MHYAKFRNRITEYNGVPYHSKAEAGYAQELDLRVKAKDIKEWRRQVPIKICVNGKKICTYNLDFEITHNDSSVELVEIKGFETAVWKLKKKLLEATYLLENPLVRYSVVKV